MKEILRVVLVFIVMISLSAPVLSQTAKRAAPARQKKAQAASQVDKAMKNFVIRVTTAGTSTPVADAKVNIMGVDGDIIGTGRATDADGVVTVAVADGVYVVNVGKPGFRQTQKDIEKIGYTSVNIHLIAEDVNALKGSDVLGSSTIFSRDMCAEPQKELTASELCGMTIPVMFRVRDNSDMDVSNATVVFVKEVNQTRYAVTGVTDLDGFASLDMPDVAPPAEFMIFAEGYQPVRYVMDKRLDVSSPPVNVFLLPMSGS